MILRCDVESFNIHSIGWLQGRVAHICVTMQFFVECVHLHVINTPLINNMLNL